MQVYKFGGASVNSLDRIQSLVPILQSVTQGPILIVVSAMGKTTNALEKVAAAFFEGDQSAALTLFEQVKQQHLTTAKYLLVKEYLACEQQLQGFFTEVEWLLHDKPVQQFDYYYDQIVCIGELLSTAIISAYFKEAGVANVWIDVRDILRTDDNFRDANIDFNFSQQQVDQLVKPLLEQYQFVITQGFIGSTDENESTTLGREGSDYTAAVFANLLDAESQTIWKDVPGVMNADPKLFSAAQLLPQLNYSEVIEMAYYGAQVIHPKTIKPLENKGIPLLVKCFLDPTLPGTTIHSKPVKDLPPIIVWKKDQVLCQLKSKDFSFVGEGPLAQLYQLFAELSVRPSMTQNGAIVFTCVIDNNPEKIEQLATRASDYFDVHLEKGLSLLTIRHSSNGLLKQLLPHQTVLLKQETPDTILVLYRAA